MASARDLAVKRGETVLYVRPDQLTVDRRLAAQIVKALRDAKEDILVEKLEAAIRK